MNSTGTRNRIVRELRGGVSELLDHLDGSLARLDQLDCTPDVKFLLQELGATAAGIREELRELD